MSMVMKVEGITNMSSKINIRVNEIERQVALLSTDDPHKVSMEFAELYNISDDADVARLEATVANAILALVRAELAIYKGFDKQLPLKEAHDMEDEIIQIPSARGENRDLVISIDQSDDFSELSPIDTAHEHDEEFKNNHDNEESDRGTYVKNRGWVQNKEGDTSTETVEEEMDKTYIDKHTQRLRAEYMDSLQRSGSPRRNNDTVTFAYD